MTDGDAHIADLTDALARGRLTAAEIAAIPPHELEALFEVGALRLDTGRDAQAADVFAGLVALFPYVAKYWRAYGIALHRGLELHRARAAYDAALLLEPESPATLCYRGEVLLYLGELDAARRDLEAVAADPAMGERARGLLGCFEALSGWTPPPPPAPAPREVDRDGTFILGDGRRLPLSEGRFGDDDAEDEATAPAAPARFDDEVTATAGAFVPQIADLWEPATGSGVSNDGDHAITRTRTAARGPEPFADASTSTRPLRQVTQTDLIPGRLWGPAAMARVETAPLPPAPFDDAITETGVIPGRPALERSETSGSLRPTGARSGDTGKVPRRGAPPAEPRSHEPPHRRADDDARRSGARSGDTGEIPGRGTPPADTRPDETSGRRPDDDTQRTGARSGDTGEVRGRGARPAGTRPDETSGRRPDDDTRRTGARSGDTGKVPGRRARPAETRRDEPSHEVSPRGRRDEDARRFDTGTVARSREVTQTAVLRRRLQMPLIEDPVAGADDSASHGSTTSERPELPRSAAPRHAPLPADQGPRRDDGEDGDG